MYRIRLVDGGADRYAKVLRTLHDATFGDTAPMVATDYGNWWIVYCNDDPVAFAGLVPSFSTPHTGYLKRSGVIEGHRGHGLQRRLLRAREARGKKIGFKALASDTTSNVPSANNMIRSGYRLYTPEYPWGFENTLYWWKDL